MKHFEYVLYVGFDVRRNLCDKQNVLFYGTPVKCSISRSTVKIAVNVTIIFSRILRKNIENRKKLREDQKWILDRLQNQMPKKSKNRPRKRRKICQRDENWNKFIGFHLFEYNYPTILPSMFTSRMYYRKKV